MSITEAYHLQVLEVNFPYTHILHGTTEHWVKNEALELEGHPEEKDDWTNFLLEYGDNVRA